MSRNLIVDFSHTVLVPLERVWAKCFILLNFHKTDSNIMKFHDKTNETQNALRKLN